MTETEVVAGRPVRIETVELEPVRVRTRQGASWGLVPQYTVDT
jgi:hypothetical protein